MSEKITYNNGLMCACSCHTEIRNEFNKTRNPAYFLFLTRTCYNGLIRYNKNNEFNVSLHHTRNGIEPKKLENIILDWNKLIQNINFSNQDYKQFLSNINNGFVYKDANYNNKQWHRHSCLCLIAFTII